MSWFVYTSENAFDCEYDTFGWKFETLPFLLLGKIRVNERENWIFIPYNSSSEKEILVVTQNDEMRTKWVYEIMNETWVDKPQV